MPSARCSRSPRRSDPGRVATLPARTPIGENPRAGPAAYPSLASIVRAALGGGVSVLERFGPLYQKGEGRIFGHRPMPRAFWDDKDLARAKHHDRLARDLDAKCAFPAEEHFVLVVRVPGEFAIKLRDTNDRVIHTRHVVGLPRRRETPRGQADVDLAIAYLAYSTARVSRITVILI